MNGAVQKTESIMNDPSIRCAKCGKLLAKHLPSTNHFEIKCPRCGTLNTVLEKMIEQVIITDTDGRILFINNSVEKATGYTANEAIGKRPTDLWGNQMDENFYKKMWQVLRDEKRTFQESLTNKNKKGELYKVEMTISPILDTQGKVIFYVAIEVIVHPQTVTAKAHSDGRGGVGKSEKNVVK